MIQWYKKVVFENYANFNGRARRSEYWYFTLMNLIVVFTVALFAGFMTSLVGEIGSLFFFLYIIILLATLIPGLAVMVRRLHDVGKSGWFFLIYFVPLIGAIWLLITLCTEGENRPNKYGNDPKNEIDEIDEIGIAQEY